MAQKRKTAAKTGDGRIILVEEDVPPIEPGKVLVEVHASLISPGTEMGSWRGFARKRENPDADWKPQPFGYSNAGVVLEVGEGVTRFKPGDRVACMGGGAKHTEYSVVAHHLCVKLPDNVSFAQGTFGNLGCTSMNAVRRSEPEFGEYVAVVGLGIVGHLAGRIWQNAGCYVIGWDMIPSRIALAKKAGFTAAVQIGKEDEKQATLAFTGGAGLDAALLAFGGDATAAAVSLKECFKQRSDGHRMGRIVEVGGATVTLGLRLTNMDFRVAARTGPGYHDDAWEVGADYPAVLVRWSTRTNLELMMRLISDGKVDVDALITHRIPLENVESGISSILDDPDNLLGVVLEMKQ